MSDDWQLLLDTLTNTPGLVISVSPQGPVGLLREGAAMFYGLNEMLRHGSGYPLIDRLRQDLQAASARPAPAGPARSDNEAEPDGVERAPGKDLDTLRRETLERCRRANQALLSQATPEEAAYYRRGLLWVCLQTARAAREGGGLFGIGAVQVTDEEKEALRQIAYAFGLPAGESLVEQLPEAPPRGVPAGMSERFSVDEWNLVCQAPLWIGFAVITAHPSGPLGAMREIEALAQVLQAARLQHPDNQALAAIWEDLSTHFRERVQQLDAQLPVQPGGGKVDHDGVMERASQRIRQAAEVLEARLEREEAVEFKQVLLDLAQRVAEAGREGGFLGLGGQTISAREQEAIRRIAEALRMG